MTTPADLGAAAARRDDDDRTRARTAEQIWWSGKGRIACAEHVPKPGSDGWWADRWELADPNWTEGYERSHGGSARCEACVAIAELARLDEEPS